MFGIGKKKDTQQPLQLKEQPKQEQPKKAKVSLDGQYPGLNAISYFIGYLEQFLAVLSEPLLISCAAVAVIDFITGGHLLEIAFISYVWAGSLAVAVTACFIVTWRRSIRAFGLNRYGAGILLAFLGVLLGVVDFAAIAVQSLQQTLHISFEQALTMLNLNVVAMTYIRSGVTIAMAVVVAISNNVAVTTASAPKRRLALLDYALNYIAPVVTEQSQQAPVNTLPEQVSESVSEQVVEHMSKQDSEQESEQEAITEKLSIVTPQSSTFVSSVPSRKRTGTANSKVSTSLKAKRVQKLLEANPDASLTELAKKAHVTRGYASQVRSKHLSEQQAPQNGHDETVVVPEQLVEMDI